jgi:cysteinyl-tRNA synthetase
MATIQVFNTLTRRKEPLTPLQPGKVGIYLCGPTVYDDCHIGHLMGPVLFDACVRWLAVRGFQVRLVNNLTDIDDKIIKRSLDSGETWLDLTRRYTAQYLGYLKRLHALQPVPDRIEVLHPRCSDYIPQMIRYVHELLAAGRAYVVDGDGVYFDIQQQPGYGKLSGRRLDEMIAGKRIERDSRLRHPADFALWKQAKPGEPSWDSPWGQGRPGWHIECSVMATDLLGQTFDIHAGGDDLKFPHHENEIAQGEAHGGGYAKLWMHNGLIQYQGVKVGKSDVRMKETAFRRQFMADHLLDTYGAATVRFMLLQGHYRRPNDFAPEHLEDARTALGRLHRHNLGRSYKGLGIITYLDEPTLPDPDEVLKRRCTSQQKDLFASLRDDFFAAMDDDFNTGQAIAALHGIDRAIPFLPNTSDPGPLDQKATEAQNHEGTLLLRDLGRLIGLFLPGDGADTAPRTVAKGTTLASVMDLVLDLRQQARAAKDFATSDRIRDALAKAGFTVKDGKNQTLPEGSGSLEAVMALVLDLRQRAHATGDAATDDRIRVVLAKAGIVIKDGPDGTAWEIAR